MTRQNIARNKAARNINTGKGFRRALLYRGIAGRVATQLNVSRSHVHRVLNGERSSKRISAALEREIRRIEREVERES